jgi:glycosyltransferase involved in cell wall biosynthesis
VTDTPHTPATVSAIVIFLDARSFIAEAIESVLAQTFTSWELLLVDDGSSDGSREVAEAYASRHPGRIRTLEHEGRMNRGMSVSRNLGLEAARGEYVGFLDADDRWTPGKLMLQVSAMEHDERLAAVFGSIEFFGELAEMPARVIRPSVPLDVSLDPALLLCETLLGRPPLLTTLGNPLIRRSALVEVGGLEDEFAGQAEDAVAWCKLALRFRFAAVADTVLQYRRHESASGAIDARSGALAAGHARFSRWLYDYVLRQPPETRAWALPIVTEHLFRSVVLEAWLTLPDDTLRRRARLIKAWRDLSQTYPDALTARRRLRMTGQLAAGLRSGALRGLQESDVCPEAF